VVADQRGRRICDRRSHCCQWLRTTIASSNKHILLDSRQLMPEVDILILGAGWLSTFLIPLCKERSITYVATTRSGRDSTIGFNFDPDSNDVEPYKFLPDASTVLITFPIEKAGASTRLIELYQSSGSNQARSRARFIQLGTISIWDVSRF
jgi:hypothetical protein